MFFEVELSKKIRIQSVRFMSFYWVINILMVGVVVANFMSQRSWSEEISVAHSITVSMWTPRAINTTALNNTATKVLARPNSVCNTPGVYDYQWDARGQWKYTNYTCASVCETGSADVDCVTGLQAMSSSLNEAFFATEVTRTFTEELHGGQQVHELNYFIPLEEEYKLTFQYAFRVAESKLNTKFLNIQKEKAVNGLSSEDVHTVIIDSDNHVRRHVPPSTNGVELSMKDMLEFAKRGNALDQEQPELGSNKLKGASYVLGPVGRLSGMEVHIKLNCYNSGNVPNALEVGSWTGHACSAQITPAPPKWVFRTSMDILQGKTTMSRYHGIRVVFDKEGIVHIFSYHALISFLTQSFVLMQIPNRFARFVLLNMLGHLSRIYGGVLTENFKIAQHVSALALQTMMRGFVFDSLTGDRGGISLGKLSQYMEKHLDFTSLDSKGLRAFSLFSFAMALDIQGHGKVSTALSGQCKQWKLHNDDGNDDDPVATLGVPKTLLGINSFMTTTAITERLHFNDAIKLFDRERRLGFAERFFLPAFVREDVIAPTTEVKRFLEMPLEALSSEDPQQVNSDVLQPNQETSRAEGDFGDLSALKPHINLKDDELTATEANQHMDLDNLRQLVSEYRAEQQETRQMLQMLVKSVADLQEMQVKTGAKRDEECFMAGCSQSGQELAQRREDCLKVRESQAQDRRKLAALTEHVSEMMEGASSLQAKQQLKNAILVQQFTIAVRKQEEEVEHLGDQLMKHQADKQNDKTQLSELSWLYSDCCLTCKVHAEQLRHSSNLIGKLGPKSLQTQPAPQQRTSHIMDDHVWLQTHAASC